MKTIVIGTATPMLTPTAIIPGAVIYTCRLHIVIAVDYLKDDCLYFTFLLCVYSVDVVVISVVLDPTVAVTTVVSVDDGELTLEVYRYVTVENSNKLTVDETIIIK